MSFQDEKSRQGTWETVQSSIYLKGTQINSLLLKLATKKRVESLSFDNLLKGCLPLMVKLVHSLCLFQCNRRMILKILIRCPWSSKLYLSMLYIYSHPVNKFGAYKKKKNNTNLGIRESQKTCFLRHYSFLKDMKPVYSIFQHFNWTLYSNGNVLCLCCPLW